VSETLKRVAPLLAILGLVLVVIGWIVDLAGGDIDWLFFVVGIVALALAAVTSLPMLAGAGPIARGGGVKIRPRQAQPGDMWCVYEINAKRGGGALNVGDKICIWCPPPQQSCPNIGTVEVAQGVEYDLNAPDNVICTDCPSNNTYQR
jgi:hypothetical protein